MGRGVNSVKQNIQFLQTSSKYAPPRQATGILPGLHIFCLCGARVVCMKLTRAPVNKIRLISVNRLESISCELPGPRISVVYGASGNDPTARLGDATSLLPKWLNA